MVSRLQIKAAPSGRDIVEVTPDSAGWEHVGFKAIRLAAGERESIATGARELCLVVLSGTVDVAVDKQQFPSLGVRDSVFDEVSPAALYVPPGKAVRVLDGEQKVAGEVIRVPAGEQEVVDEAGPEARGGDSL